MGSKRRRARFPSSSVSGRDFGDGQPSSSASSVRRKRRRTSNIPTVDPIAVCHELYNTIRVYKDDQGRMLCELFIRESTGLLPHDEDPAEAEDGGVRDVDQITSDFQLLFNNAKAYYKVIYPCL
uniref:Bromo domain-containing protein n=1 Tax=Oncorhynchus tshawytscha TaxID=74940 RepID=A0A8C8GCY8_ONCTS